MTRNITLKLEDEIVNKAKVIAAKRGTSVSGLLRGEILRIVREETAFVAARNAARKRLQRGHRLGGNRLPKRDELYER
jgi:hypothetical protein